VEDVINITILSIPLAKNWRFVLTDLKESASGDFGRSRMIAVDFVLLCKIWPIIGRDDICSTSLISVILLFRKSLEIIIMNGKNNPKNAAII